MLSPKLLEELRAYWRGLRRPPKVWLFRLILADLRRPQLIGSPVEVSGKILDGADVCPCCTLIEIATLELFEHRFAKTGHRDLLSL